MAPTNPSGPPPAPALGSGSFPPHWGGSPRGAGGPAGRPTISASAQSLLNSYNPPDDSDDEDDLPEDPNPMSPIVIDINTPLQIRGDGNLIAIEPSVTSDRVAMGVIQALRQMTLESGFSMVDEQGRARPITVKVTAGTIVEGSKNLVGERAVMQRIAPELSTMAVRETGLMKLDLGQILRKRDRAAEKEEGEEDSSKRTRRD